MSNNPSGSNPQSNNPTQGGGNIPQQGQQPNAQYGQGQYTQSQQGNVAQNPYNQQYQNNSYPQHGNYPAEGQQIPQNYQNQQYYNQQANYQQQPGYNQVQPQYQNPQYPLSSTQTPASMASLREIVDQELERIVPKEFSRWFGSIQYRPRRMKFATQNVGEKVYILVRMHWIRNIGWILNNIFYSMVPFITLVILQLLRINLDFLSLRIFVIILLAYYSIIFSNVIRNFYDWYFDVYIVTNERIVDYVFDPFKGYHVTEAPLESIEDVEEKSLGFLADLFNYGSVKARTASNAGELSFDYIADPTRVRDIIMDLAKIIKTYKNHD